RMLGQRARPVRRAGTGKPVPETVHGVPSPTQLDTVDAGGIDDSWRQQPGTPVYGLQAGAEAVRKALSQAPPERPADFRG
ncbi:NADP oxidoreductase, partial [Streptomyces sp. NPDC020362]